MPRFRRRRPRRRPRRAPFRRRRFRRRRTRVGPGNLITKQFVTDVVTVPLSALAGDFVAFHKTFQLSDIDPIQLSAWQRCFSAFRLTGIKMTLSPIETNTASVGDTTLCTLYSASTVDPNASPWANEDAALTTAKVRKKLFGRYNLPRPVWNHSVTPRTHLYVSNPGSLFSGQALGRRNQWLNLSGDTTTPHAGIRYAFNFDDAHPEVTYKLIVEYKISFRNVI